jgi:predicted RecA/RadA family phage recombinase
MATIGNWIKQHEAPYSHKYYIDTTIANAGTDTDIIDCGNYDIIGISTDSAFDGTSLAIQTGVSDSALKAVSDEFGVVRAIQIAASEYVEVDIGVSMRWARYVKFVASSQTGATVLRIHARRLGEG